MRRPKDGFLDRHPGVRVTAQLVRRLINAHLTQAGFSLISYVEIIEGDIYISWRGQIGVGRHRARIYWRNELLLEYKPPNDPDSMLPPVRSADIGEIALPSFVTIDDWTAAIAQLERMLLLYDLASIA